ncbi:MAG TPA: FHA domain-containing protein [Candidatus Dormibacteraeota bacterium]|jgi:hypothetical protein|nr:FHA domain-containing protein [Candidatus Dormibacteraeota bacterium]
MTGPALAIGQLLLPVSRLINTVGRKDRITNQVPDLDLATLDQERGVSRKHAELTYADGRIRVRDVGSTNGTTVNDEPLALQVDRVLSDGDRVSFGGLEMVFVAQAEWPEGLVAEWPDPAAEPEPAPLAAEETSIFSAEETMIHAPSAEETSVFAPGAATTPGWPAAAPASDAGTHLEHPAEADGPDGAPGGPTAEVPAAGDLSPAAPGEAAAAAESDPSARAWEPPSVRIAPEAPAGRPSAAAESSAVWTPCSNHPHLPAVGLCPGCLEAFCQDCLPDRGDAPMACNRCFGIQQRLGASVLTQGSVFAGAAPNYPGGQIQPAAPSGQSWSQPAPPQPAWPQPQPAAPPEDGKKKKGLFGR